MRGIAVLPSGLEEEGAQELESFGAKCVKPLKRSAYFEGDLACFYRLYLQARLPFRLLREVSRFKCNGPQSLYKEVQRALDWEKWLHPSMSFRVDVSGIGKGLTHTHFTALQVKNALIDFQKQLWGYRSNINIDQPDICLHLHLNYDLAILSLDGSAESLHRRGYRAAMGNAPLKENLAAGLIRLTNWNGLVPLIDPLCGSGTLLIEAVNHALDMPTRLGKSFLVNKWADFDSNLWNTEKELVKRGDRKNFKLPLIIGCEQDIRIANQAQDNLKAARLQNFINIKPISFSSLIVPKEKGIFVCNPPYGKRLGSNEKLEDLYKDLGCFLKENASGWQLWLLSGNSNLTRFLGMKSKKRIAINNGGIECRWLNYAIN